MATPSDPPNLSTLWGRVLVDELARCGLRHAVVAPGSRSTPLALALADHPDVEDLSVIDERSAGFVALGLARATGAPVAMVSTSGTAATNFLPAVTEADRAAVPLLVLTADRPAELWDAGDSQAADQVKLYGGRVRWFHQVAEASADERRLGYLRSTACHAWGQARGAGGPPGPVHLNLPLRKPLEPTPVADGPGALPPGFDPARSRGAAGRPGGAPWRRVTLGRAEPAATDVEEVARDLAGARRPLILVGALPGGPVDPPPAGSAPEAIGDALARLARLLPVPVWAEAASGLRTCPRPSPGLIATADLLLGSESFRAFARPDLVLRLGEAPLAWPLRRWAGELAEAGTFQVTLDAWGRRRDPEHAVARLIAADPAELLAAVAARLETRSAPAAAEAGWLAGHLAADRAAREALEWEAERWTDEGALFEGGVFWHLGRRLPDDAALVVSSSMPLRDLEAFLPASRRPVDLFLNRGLNGIDGVTSTAAGIALARRVPAAGGAPAADGRTVLVTGDVAFAHDLSGALAAGRLGADLTVVLLDNGGGAIFDYLPAAGFEPGFTRHLTTPPGAGFAEIAAGCGLRHRSPESWEGFAEALEQALADPAPHLIQLRVDRERGRAIRRGVLDRVAAAVDGVPLEDAAIEAPEPGPTAGRTAPTSFAPTPTVAGARSGPAPREASPIVLLHGFTGSAAGWDELARRLRAAGGPEVVALDLPGHGGAPAGGDLASWPEAVAGIVDALDRLALGPVRLVGYSLGARLALAVALETPGRLTSLALLGGSPGLADPEERAARRAADEALAREIEEAGLAPFVDRWMARRFFSTQHTGPSRLGHRRLRLARAERLGGTASGYAAALRALGQGAQPSYWERLGELACPTLLVAGELDSKYVEIAREMAARIPEARLERVPAAGHAVHLEAPDAVARLLLEPAGVSEGPG